MKYMAVIPIETDPMALLSRPKNVFNVYSRVND